MTWTKASPGVRQLGGGTHHRRTATKRADLIVPRGSDLPSAAKYRLLSRARRQAQETARRVLVNAATSILIAASAATLAAQPLEGQFERTLAVGDALTLDMRTGSGGVW